MPFQPPDDDGEESLEELDLDDAAVISHRSELHAPARRQPVQMEERSIVVADQGSGRQVATLRSRRALEPTLLIRDRRQADELRREMERRVTSLKRQQLRSTLMWLVAGLLAFGLGGLIALLLARRQLADAPEVEASAIGQVLGEAPEEAHTPAPQADAVRAGD